MSRIVLLGAGHAHLHLLLRGRRLVRAGHDVVLVSPGDFWYSGLVTGVIAGQYPPGMDRIDVSALASEAGIRVVADRAVASDPDGRVVRLASGDTLAYDLLSVNVGSRGNEGAVPGASEHAVGVKPIRALVGLSERLRARAADGPAQVVVIGGGASGVEIALACAARAEREGLGVRITLVGGGRLVPDFPDAAAARLRREFEERGVTLLEEAVADRVEEGAVRLSDGRRIDADIVVGATGLRPPSVLEGFGLPLGPDGGLRVDRHLRSVASDRVFAVGDCAHFEPRPLRRVGVYAVRQAPVLLHNLEAAAAGRPLRGYRPQSEVLLILNLGDGRGMAVRGRFHWTGRTSFRLKDWLDRRFLEAHRKGGAG